MPFFFHLLFSDDTREGRTALQQILSMSRDLIDENNERPHDERYPEIQHFANPFDRPAALTLARIRPRSLSGDLSSVSNMSPGVLEETPLEVGSGPTAFG